MRKNSIFHIKSALHEEGKGSTKWTSLIRHANRLNITNEVNNSVTGLTSYFTLLYYMGLMPYRFVHETDLDGGESWQLRSFIPQKILCYMFMWAPNLFFHVTDSIHVALEFYSDSNINPRKYFGLINRILLFARDLGFMLTIVTCSKEIEKLLNGLHSQRHLKLGCDCLVTKLKRMKIRGLAWIFFVLFVVFSVTIANFLFIAQPAGPLASPVDVFHETVVASKHRFFISHSNTNTAQSKFYSSLDIFLGLVETYHRFVGNFVPNCIHTIYVGPIPITLWIVVSIFVEVTIHKCKNSKTPLIKEVLAQYDEIKNISDRINSLWSVGTLGFFMDTSLRIIFKLKFYSKNMNPLNLFNMLMSLAFCSVPMYLHAEVFRKIAYFKSWLIAKAAREKDDEQFMASHKFKMYLLEIRNEPIGIGIDGFFAMNYGFFAQLWCVVMTLFILSFEE